MVPSGVKYKGEDITRDQKGDIRILYSPYSTVRSCGVDLVAEGAGWETKQMLSGLPTYERLRVLWHAWICSVGFIREWLI